MRNKRGRKNVFALIGIIIFGVLLTLWIAIWIIEGKEPISHLYNNFKEEKNINKVIEKKLDEAQWKNYNFLEKTKITLKSIPSKATSFLGFKSEWQRLSDFWGYFLIGIWTGLWIYCINLLIEVWIWIRSKTTLGRAGALRDAEKHRRSWMELVCGSWWKILIIGMVYGIIMLIPIIKNAIEFISFEYLMPDSWFIRSFILAFYIGFGPAAIEQIHRYRLRMQYYKRLMDVKYGVKTMRAVSSG